jgi:hypothetical protein
MLQDEVPEDRYQDACAQLLYVYVYDDVHVLQNKYA